MTEPSDDIQKLWLCQETEESDVTLAGIQDGAGACRRMDRHRNRRIYLALGIVVLGFGWATWMLPGPMEKAGGALVVATALFLAWRTHRRASVRRILPASEMNVVDCLRRELVRQRDDQRFPWRSPVVPIFPGLLLMWAGIYFDAPPAGRDLALHLLLTRLMPAVILIFGAVWLFKVWRAGRLQRRIDELDKQK